MLWLFFPFVVILSGVVAYAADTIAKKVGRKHIRWFGLRPKTTALIVAVLSGMAISAASLLAFLLLNRSAVATITQAGQLRPQIERLKREKNSVQSKLTTVKTDLQQVQNERDQARNSASQLMQQQQQAEATLLQAKQRLSVTQSERQRLQKEAKSLNEQLDKLETLQKELANKVSSSQKALTASQQRAQKLDAEVVDLRLNTAQAQRESEQAQARSQAAIQRAEQASQQANEARQKAAKVQSQARQQTKAAQAEAASAQAKALKLKAENTAAAQARDKAISERRQAQLAKQKAEKDKLKAEKERQQIQLSRNRAQQERQAAIKARDKAQRERQAAVKARAKAQQELKLARNSRDQAQKERDILVSERRLAMSERDKVRQDLQILKREKSSLTLKNNALTLALSKTQSKLRGLQDDYSSARDELSASRNADLAFVKNELVHAGVVPSVRNLDAFFKNASRSAANRGAKRMKGILAITIAEGARKSLETKLRGLNASSFVYCRAAQNTAIGFSVDLTCDAKPNKIIYGKNSIIRQAVLNNKATDQELQSQIGELVSLAIMDLIGKGILLEKIDDQGIDPNEMAKLLKDLSNSNKNKVLVAISTRKDIRPSTTIDLYPVLP